MNIAKEKIIEQLQRQLEEKNAAISQLQQTLQSQQFQPFSSPPSNAARSSVDLSRHGMVPSYFAFGDKSTALSRSKSTISYPTQMPQPMVNAIRFVLASIN